VPGKNEVKLYIENGVYHIYNRGVEKRKIFQDKQDYAVFCSYLKVYLSPKNIDEISRQLANPKLSRSEKTRLINMARLNNFSNEIVLIAYCLMPNHFHLLVKQKSRDTIDKFMNSLGTRYTMYFNRKYDRVGKLYEGTYKAVLVTTDEQLLHLTRYIHKNPTKLSSAQGDPLYSQPSSLAEYLGLKKTPWVDPKEVLAFFSKTNPKLSYKNFLKSEEDKGLIKDLAID